MLRRVIFEWSGSSHKVLCLERDNKLAQVSKATERAIRPLTC